MAINEEARIPVYINDEQARSALKNLSKEAERLNKAIQEAAASGDMIGMKKAQTELRKVNSEMKNIKKSSFDVNAVLNNLKSASINDLKRTMVALRREQSGLNRDTKEYIALQQKIDQVNGELRKINGTVTTQKGIFGNLVGSMKGLLPALSIGAVVAGITSIGRSIIQTRTEFSRYEAVLKNTLGSQAAANKAFSDLKKFAANTPFQLNELTDSYVKLTNQGFQPTMEEMTKLGDLASAMGKDFNQLTEAIIDAQTGENERLKEFGIKAQKDGNIIRYTFKGVTTEVDNNAEAIRKYVLSLGDMEGVKGGMAEISKTVGGAISNSKDAVENLWNTIGERLEPIVVKVLGWFTEIINKFSDWIGKAGGGFDQLYNWFADFYNKSLPVRVAIEGIELAFTTVFTVVKAQFQSIFNVFKTSGQIIKAIFTGNFKEIPEIINKSMDKQQDIIVQNARKLAEKAKDSYNDALKGKLEIKAKVVTEEETVKKTTTKKPPKISEKQVKEDQDKALKALDEAYKERQLIIEQNQSKQQQDEDIFQNAMLIAEYAYLEQKKALLTEFGRSTTEVDREINKNRLDAQKKADEELLKWEEESYKEFENKAKEDAEIQQDILNDSVDANIKAGEAALKALEDIKEKEKRINDERASTYMDLASGIGDAFGSMLADQEGSFQDFLKNTLLMALDALEKLMWLNIAESTMKGIAQGGIGMIKALAKVVAIKAAFAIAKSSVSKIGGGNKEKKGFETGGYTGYGNASDPAGVVHRGEYVVPASIVNSPAAAPVISWLEKNRLNGGMMNTSAAASMPSSNPKMEALLSQLMILVGGGIASNEKLMEWKPKVYTELIKKDLDTLDHINKNRNL